MAAIDEIFRIIKEQGASDLHMASGSKPMIRLHSSLQAVDYAELTPELNRKLLYELMSPEQVKQFEKHKEIDFGYEIPGVTRIRCNIFEQRNGIGGVFRLIPTEILTLDQLNLPAQLTKFCDLHRGLVVVTGATGSGKSTTLAAMIDYINDHQPKHILTIEDPIEFVHKMKKALINQREVGSTTHSFANALRAALREEEERLAKLSMAAAEHREQLAQAQAKIQALQSQRKQGGDGAEFKKKYAALAQKMKKQQADFKARFEEQQAKNKKLEERYQKVMDAVNKAKEARAARKKG